MCRIGCQEESSHSEGFRTSLMQFIWTGTGKLIVARLWIAGQDFREPFWLPCEIFFVRKAPDISVRHSPQSTVRQPRCHIPIIFVNDEVGVPISKFFEVIINLVHVLVSESQPLAIHLH